MSKVEIREVGSILSTGHLFIGDPESFQPTVGVEEDWSGEWAQVRAGGRRVATLLKVEEGEWEVSCLVGDEGEVVEYVLRFRPEEEEKPPEPPEVLKI